MANVFIKRFLIAACAAFLAASVAHAAIDVPSDGSDGAFTPTSSVTIDLSQAVTGTWDQAGTGKGVYDPVKWAVVFKYSAVNIPTGVTVSFTNNAFRAPVVWLVQGDVTISGTVNLNGQPGGPSGVFAEPGPGAFRGAGLSGSSGLGPGGGSSGGATSSSSYGAKGCSPSGPTYGNAMTLPLIGGSGGWGACGATGGAGGGAILIAARNGVTVNGSITARGGPSCNGGSGGAIRLLTDSLVVSASLSAEGQACGGAGRIVLEANQMQISSPSISPMAAMYVPANPPRIWPEPAAPSVKITRVGGVNVPADPRASFDFPKQDLSLATSDAVTVRVEATNVPTSWSVVVRTVPKIGPDTTTNATLVSGDASASVWEAQVTMPKGFAALQVRAFNP